MNRTLLLTLLALAAPARAATTPSPISPPSFATGVPAADVGLFADRVAFFDPAARGEGNNNTLNALGAADFATVSLGDLTSDELIEGRSPGVIVVEFSNRVFDGPGADLAVFENAFNLVFDGPASPFVFAELAFVEVSTNGADFARFPSLSLNVEPTAAEEVNELLVPFGRDFAALNSEFVSGLAGIHAPGFGTPFDLADLSGEDAVVNGLVDLGDIRFVRIVDIPGTGEFVDSIGNPILDASVTVDSGGFPPTEGFDLDAVGALNFVPEPSSLAIGLIGFGLTTRRRRRG